MAIFQNKLKEELEVPIFLSSMLQVPFVLNLLDQEAKIGILSANGASLNDKKLLKEVGIQNSDNIIIKGLESKENFNQSIIKEVGVLEPEKIEKEVVQTAQKMVKNHPEIKAILQECSVLPPYSKAVQKATKLPVFDYITMIKYVYSAVVQKNYQGIY